jgi:hypothetical protein
MMGSKTERADMLIMQVRVASPRLLIDMKSRSERQKDAQDVLALQSYLAGLAARHPYAYQPSAYRER